MRKEPIHGAIPNTFRDRSRTGGPAVRLSVEVATDDAPAVMDELHGMPGVDYVQLQLSPELFTGVSTVEHQQSPAYTTSVIDVKTGEPTLVFTHDSLKQFSIDQRIPMPTQYGQLAKNHTRRERAKALKRRADDFVDLSPYAYILDGEIRGWRADTFEQLTHKLERDRIALPNVGHKTIEFMKFFGDTVLPSLPAASMNLSAVDNRGRTL